MKVLTIQDNCDVDERQVPREHKQNFHEAELRWPNQGHLAVEGEQVIVHL